LTFSKVCWGEGKVIGA